MKKKKNLKGMTLIEIIVSLAILSVLTLVLVQTSNTINTYIKSTKNVNQKTVVQSPVAEMGYKDDTVAAVTQVATDVEIIVKYNGKQTVVKGDAYEVGERATDSEGNQKNELGGNLNMQFIDLKLNGGGTP